MNPSTVHRRLWSSVVALAATVLAVTGVVATPPSHLPALAATTAAIALAGTAWAATSATAALLAATRPSSPGAAAHQRAAHARRATAYPAIGVLVAVGAGHAGPWALLVVVVLLVTCPWGVALLRRSGRPDRHPDRHP